MPMTFIENIPSFW